MNLDLFGEEIRPEGRVKFKWNRISATTWEAFDPLRVGDVYRIVSSPTRGSTIIYQVKGPGLDFHYVKLARAQRAIRDHAKKHRKRK